MTVVAHAPATVPKHEKRFVFRIALAYAAVAALLQVEDPPGTTSSRRGGRQSEANLRGEGATAKLLGDERSENDKRELLRNGNYAELKITKLSPSTEASDIHQLLGVVSKYKAARGLTPVKKELLSSTRFVVHCVRGTASTPPVVKNQNNLAHDHSAQTVEALLRQTAARLLPQGGQHLLELPPPPPGEGNASSLQLISNGHAALIPNVLPGSTRRHFLVTDSAVGWWENFCETGAGKSKRRLRGGTPSLAPPAAGGNRETEASAGTGGERLSTRLAKSRVYLQTKTYVS